MERREREAGEGNAVIVLIYRAVWLGERRKKRQGIMPLSGAFAEFVIFCMNNRDREG